MPLIESRPRLVVLGLTSLAVGVLALAFVLPWTMHHINETASVMEMQREQLDAEHAFERQPPIQPREPIQPLDLFPKQPEKPKQLPVVQEEPKVAEKSELAPTHIDCGTGQRIPLEGRYGSAVAPCGGQWFASVHLPFRNSWVDQPASHSPRVVRTDLRYQWTQKTEPKPRPTPCRMRVRVPAGRVYLPNREEGYIDAPARWATVPCRMP